MRHIPYAAVSHLRCGTFSAAFEATIGHNCCVQRYNQKILPSLRPISSALFAARSFSLISSMMSKSNGLLLSINALKWFGSSRAPWVPLRLPGSCYLSSTIGIPSWFSSAMQPMTKPPDEQEMEVNCRDLNAYGELQTIRKKGYRLSQNEKETHDQHKFRTSGA